MELVCREMIDEFKNAGTRFSPHVPEFPEMVLIEVTTRCNLSCVHCPHDELSSHEGFLGDINPVLYRKVIDEVAEFPETWLRPFNGGEPLMRRDLPELIHYAKDKGIRQVGITSNGTLLGERMRRELVEAGLDHLEVSIDAATPETYLSIRRAPLFQKVVDNTLRFIEEAKRAGSNRTIIVSFVAQALNSHEIPAFEEFWRGKADAVTIREYHQHNNLVRAEGRAYARTMPHRHPCPYLFERLIVHHNGKVRFCESDWEASHPIGDAHTQTLKEIWHGDSYRRLRKQHIEGTFDHEFCKTCTDWHEVRWPGQ
jgi:radical SAM protein with 4Fe4S-binding SPASM domain